MLSPSNVNPLTLLWRIVYASHLLSHSTAKFVKLVEIVIVHVVGSLEDESDFSSLSFLKTKQKELKKTSLTLLISTCA